jgi:hypothetical protein
MVYHSFCDSVRTQDSYWRTKGISPNQARDQQHLILYRPKRSF